MPVAIFNRNRPPVINLRQRSVLGCAFTGTSLRSVSVIMIRNGLYALSVGVQDGIEGGDTSCGYCATAPFAAATCSSTSSAATVAMAANGRAK